MRVLPLLFHNDRVLENFSEDDAGEVSRFIINFGGARRVFRDDVSNDAGPHALKRVDLNDDPRPAEAGDNFVELGNA